MSLNCLIKGSRSFLSLLMSFFGEGEKWLPKDQLMLVSGPVLRSHVAMVRSTTALLNCTSSSSHFMDGELSWDVKRDWEKFIHLVTVLSEIHSHFAAPITAAFHLLKA